MQTATGRKAYAPSSHARIITLVGLLLALVIGCSDTQPMRVSGADINSNNANANPAPAGDANVGGGSSAPGVASEGGQSTADMQELEQLWQRRTAQTSSTEDYPIGPGDVLEISVPEMEELQQRKVRVTTQGLIELPLVGNVQAGGLTEEQLQDELDQKLNKFMYNPQASIFVDQYHNRQVAVIGAVSHPGLVLLDSPSETVLDVLSQAGGLTGTAADEIILIPAEQTDPNMARQLSAVALSNDSGSGTDAPTDAASSGGADANLAAGQVGGAGGSHSMRTQGEPIAPGNQSLSMKAEAMQKDRSNDIATTALRMLPTNARPVSIPVRSTTLTGAGRYVNLPVRPGDVIVVPGGGNVMVVGWVEQPGYFQVGSGLTVMGAIGAAGGTMYAADTHNVTLIRSDASGSKSTIVIDMDKVSHGEEQDIPVKANDVIDVPYSSLRIGPYVFYSIISRIGVGAAAIPF
ncbi:MAG TPA: polysaccharide biosynthesis/export family protein [Candidatus Binataceae bacterium]|nr:polysaccharide biosynthesis/export family protein [Candidatus Binataceae bacterium]